MTQLSTVIGVFADRDQANRAIDELRRVGFGYDRIRSVARGSGNFLDTLKSLFTGQESTTSNNPADMMKLGMPEKDAPYYQHELDTGRVIVALNADERPEQAFSVIRQHGAFDISSHMRTAAENAPVGANNPNAPAGTYNRNVSQEAYNPNMPPGMPNPNPNVPPGRPDPNVPSPIYNPNATAGTDNPNASPETSRKP